MTGIAERPSTAPRILTPAHLTSRQRATLRSHLAGDLEKTRRLVEQLGADMDSFTASRRDSTTDDEHDPEGPTLAFEHSQSSAILAQSIQHIADIDAALLRMDEGTYGLCKSCGGPIAVGRLQVRPQAPLCITCAGKLR